ncbi:MAG: ABC transporter permease [Propionicimonas sp.]|uniref:ABC transporter permease n=1 Tax=Propionicimonas sp. TaxID=1955623 RepID=UPI001D288C09|nr:ABC transporter permease [Propionicimonas sp.]MBU4205469.1 ABC transporter permease [Actinomycetota bacterium]MBU4248736.1 ABC transporter permease [Actinomycetota bacterium]MBU4365465.1 ABC transporter permease [Actinomycetota bacterium]MBU4410875.1 ABC transporter permease [Actinomycetota bacterium]MBU4417182.1 ABC transporter permease [Actinomycetota bacterium]
MNLLWEWLADPNNWSGPEGVWARLIEHLSYSLATLVIAAVVGIPLGLWIGHTGKGRLTVVNLVNGMRSVPTLGLLFVAVLVVGPLLAGDVAFLGPAIFVLVILAIPPILAGAYAGVEGVDPGVRDAARGMGMGELQVLTKVEIPVALPLIFSGLRSAALQVVATATIAASVSVGGLGRFLIDGQAYRDYGEMAAGALLVALLAVCVDLVFAAVQRLVVSPGLAAPNDSPRLRAAPQPVPATT